MSCEDLVRNELFEKPRLLFVTRVAVRASRAQQKRHTESRLEVLAFGFAISPSPPTPLPPL